jgi:glucose/arabinose dehydrogenase
MNSLPFATAFAVLVLFVTTAFGAYWLGYSPINQTPDATIPVMDGEVAYRVEEVVRGLEVPWGIAFTSPTRILVTERPGRVRVIENGALKPEPLHTFTEVSSGGEEGLMSIIVHPEYASNRFVYTAYAYQGEGGMRVDVVRFKDEGDSISGITPIVSDIPAARFHAGCELAFGPDGKLYITTGDATERELAQDLDSLAGKILRVNDDGSIPEGNPFPQSLIWSYGHRNPQGIAWDSNGDMYETEHGPSGFDGPGGGDEVNKIVMGGNYGWPLVSHEESKEGTVAPLLVFTPAEAPGSAMMYSGKLFPQFKDNLFFGALRGENLMRVSIGAEPGAIGFERLFHEEYGRIREVTEDPDGAIYFTSSNRDGRGSPSEGDDRIFRIVPLEG